MIDKLDFGHRLAVARMDHEYSQETLALALGIHRVQVSRYELGKVLPSLNTYVRLCDVLGLDYGYLLDFRIT